MAGRVAKKKALAEGGDAAKKKSLTSMSLKDIKKARARKEMEKDSVHPEFVPQLPSVNLFPPNVRDDIHAKKALKIVTAVGGVAIVAIGALWWMQGPSIDQANENLAAANAESSQLQEEIRGLTPVKTLYNQITAQEDIVNKALDSRVDTTLVLDEFTKLSQSSQLTVSNFTIGYEKAPTTKGNCPSPDPFATKVTVGCITFMATAPSTQAVAQFLQEAELNPNFTNAYTGATTVSEDDGTVSFNATMALTPAVLQVPLTPEQIAALEKPVEATPPAPTGSEGGATDGAAENPAG